MFHSFIDKRSQDSFWKAFDQSFLGFDKLFSGTLSSNQYPPYSIIQDDNEYIIEMAVAGFGKEHIEVREEEQDYKKILKVSGDQGNAEKIDKQKHSYIYRGLAKRNFEILFNLHPSLEVNKVVLRDGILKIYIITNEKEDKSGKIFNIE